METIKMKVKLLRLHNGNKVQRAPLTEVKKLDPELKSWLEDVIIPALVQEYLAEIRSKSRT